MQQNNSYNYFGELDVNLFIHPDSIEVPYHLGLSEWVLSSQLFESLCRLVCVQFLQFLLRVFFLLGYYGDNFINLFLIQISQIKLLILHIGLTFDRQLSFHNEIAILIEVIGNGDICRVSRCVKLPVGDNLSCIVVMGVVKLAGESDCDAVYRGVIVDREVTYIRGGNISVHVAADCCCAQWRSIQADSFWYSNVNSPWRGYGSFALSSLGFLCTIAPVNGYSLMRSCVSWLAYHSPWRWSWMQHELTGSPVIGFCYLQIIKFLQLYSRRCYLNSTVDRFDDGIRYKLFSVYFIYPAGMFYNTLLADYLNFIEESVYNFFMACVNLDAEDIYTFFTPYFDYTSNVFISYFAYFTVNSANFYMSPNAYFTYTQHSFYNVLNVYFNYKLVGSCDRVRASIRRDDQFSICVCM